ncbi:hypothetical protein ON010_g16178 [Phytophthora cinnamomi]|nr:hypothetical protein ON010_g16178 [Phytophthora cinnamomi]
MKKRAKARRDALSSDPGRRLSQLDLPPRTQMSHQASLPKHSPAEKLRVLAAHRAGRADWLQVAASNGISRAAA